MSNIKVIQLRTGQFLVGDCNEGDDGSVNIRNPLEVHIQMINTREGPMPQAGLAPYAMMIKDRAFTFKPDQIQLKPSEPDDSCTKGWIQATSGIELATSLPDNSLLLNG